MNDLPIEKKYLLKDNQEFVTSDFNNIFTSVENLFYKIKYKGDFIRQTYMPIEEGKDFSKMLNLNIDFELKEAKIMQYETNYFFIIQSKDNLKKKIKISKYRFNELYNIHNDKKVEKIRLKQEINGLNYYFDLYVNIKKDLIDCKVEINSKEDLEKIITLGKEY